MKRYIIPVANSNSQKKTSKEETAKNSMNEEKLIQIIEEHLKKVDKKEYIIEVAFSNEEAQKEELLKIVYEYLKDDKIDEIRVLTNANNINKKFLKMLKKYKVKTVELEIPSVNEYVLKNIKVGYNIDDIKNAVKLIRRKRFDLGIQMMIGLPESTKTDEINTANFIIKMKPKMVGVTPFLVIKNTQFEEKYKEEKYKLLTLVQAVEICKELVGLFNNTKIDVIAIGYGFLDNDIEQLEIAEQVIDGPFHPSFRQLVESSLWYDAIVNKIKKLNVKVSQVEVTVNPIDTNNVIGYKQENIMKLKDLYDVELIVTPDEKIKQGKSKIDIVKTYEDFVKS